MSRSSPFMAELGTLEATRSVGDLPPRGEPDCTVASRVAPAKGDQAQPDQAYERMASCSAIDPNLTHVALFWRATGRQDWLRFGNPAASRIVDRRRRIESFAPGEVFALVRWAASDFGTIRSALDIVCAAAPGETITRVPQVDPGGEVLLAVRGWPKVAQVFALIDGIEASDIDAAAVAPDHWRHIHNRLAARELPRAYTLARHQAWLRRKALMP